MIFLLLDISQYFGEKSEPYSIIENAQPLCCRITIHVGIARSGQTIYLEGSDFGKMTNNNEAR
jgi:hypothetical protein